MSDFKGIGAAPAPKRTSSFTNDGTYLGKILKMKKHTSENPKTRGEKQIILELAIVEVIQGFEYTTPVFNTVKRSNEAGEVVSQFLKFRWYSFFEKMKALLCAIMEMSPEEAKQIDEDQWIEMAERAVKNDGEDVRGSIIKFRGNTIGVGPKGEDPTGEFTVIDYYVDAHAPDSEPESTSDGIPF